MSAPQTTHPITLETVVFTKCVVIGVPEYKPSKAPVPLPVNNLNVLPDPDRKGVWICTMRTTVNPEMDASGPYCIEMVCNALLRADDTLQEAEAKKGVTITAHSVLYGAIRETIAWLTGRQPHGPLLLGLSVLRGSAPPAEPEPKASPATE